MLDQVQGVVEEVPPVENGKSRFGNPAFRTFYDLIHEVRSSIRCSLTAGDAYEREN